MNSRISRALCGFSLIFAATATATTVPNLTFEEITDRSELVVAGQVTRSWSGWDNGHKYIWTHYEIAVKSTQKGRAGATVVVSEPGGVVGDSGMTIAGAVSYGAGEQVAVFLQRMPNGYLRTTGWGQGKFTVDKAGLLHADASRGSIEVMQTDQQANGRRSTPLRSLEGINIRDFGFRVENRVAGQKGSAK